MAGRVSQRVCVCVYEWPRRGLPGRRVGGRQQLRKMGRRAEELAPCPATTCAHGTSGCPNAADSHRT